MWRKLLPPDFDSDELAMDLSKGLIVMGIILVTSSLGFHIHLFLLFPFDIEEMHLDGNE